MHLYSTHFLGDGMALHTTANEFFTLLSSSGDGNIEEVLRRREGEQLVDALDGLALALESKLVPSKSWNAFGWAAAKVSYEISQSKLIVRRRLSIFYTPLIRTISTGWTHIPSTPPRPRISRHHRPNHLLHPRSNDPHPRRLQNPWSDDQ